MFGKTVLAPVALASTLAGTFVSAAVVPAVSKVVARDADPAAPAATNHALQPIPIPDGNKGTNLNLTQQDNFYWAHADKGILGNMTLSVADGYYLLHHHRISGLVDSVDCSTDDITIKFDTVDHMKQAEQSWAGVNNSPNQTVVYIVDKGTCGGLGEGHRQPYYVDSMSFDEPARIALLAATAAEWSDFVDDASIRIHGHPAAYGSGNGTITRRDESASGDFPISVDHDFSGNLFSKDIGNGITLGLECADCKTTGTLNFDLSVSLNNGMSASVTTSNRLSLQVGLGLQLSGALTDPLSFEVEPLVVGIEGFSIKDIVEIGPELALGFDAGFDSINAQVEAEFGIAVILPDGSNFSLDKPASFSPQFNPVPPTFSGSITGHATAAPNLKLQLVGEILKKGVVGGVMLQAPTLNADFGIAANTGGGICHNPNAVAGVSLSIDVGVEVNAFGGFGGKDETPNSITLFSTSMPDAIVECVAIGPGDVQEQGPPPS